MVKTASRGARVRVEPGQKRVRAYLAGHLVLDSRAPLLVWESPYYPQYYIPVGDVRAELRPTGETRRSPSRGDAEVYDVVVDEVTAPSAGWRSPASPVQDLRGTVRFDWDAMEAWFEEEEQVYVHPRNPYTRIDILPSSAEVRVELDGEVIAESGRAMVLFETGLPARYYLPKTDARQDLLVSSTTETGCPYKGTATYYSIDTGARRVDDAVWCYPAPLPESIRVAGLLSFDPRKDDLRITVDGEPLEQQ